MKKILITFILLFVVIFSLGIVAKAAVNLPGGNNNTPGINPATKLLALSSCVSLCARWGNDTVNDHTKDFYKVYLFANDINSASNLTYSSISSLAISRGLELNSSYIPSMSCTSVLINKEYDYGSDDIYIYIEIAVLMRN